MNVNRITKCVLLTLFLFIVARQCQAKEYSPEELLLLMEASYQRYKTMNAELEATYYQGYDESGKRIKQRTQEIIYRWTRDRDYSEVNERYMDRPVDMPESVLYKKSTTGKWTRKLMIGSGEGHPRGAIEPGRKSLDKFTKPNCAIWEINQSGIPMDKSNIDFSRASVQTDETTGYLIMKFRLGDHEKAAKIVLHIDPTRDYIPIINEFRTYDGRLLEKRTCKLERNPDGLWIPKEYSWENPNPEINYLAEYKVEKIEINTPIPDEQLDFEFPKGTIITDKVAGLRYETDLDHIIEDSIGQSAAESEQSSELLDVNDLNIRTIATDDELDNTITEEEMQKIKLDTERRSHHKGKIVLLGVSLLIVLVLPIFLYFRRIRQKIQNV
jgi:hypothetical protein